MALLHRLGDEGLGAMLFVSTQDTVSLIRKTEPLGPESGQKSRSEDLSRDTANG